jgi:multiple sugar transport system permease protein/raffinose/stachyose/melibiose transport system permease protein
MTAITGAGKSVARPASRGAVIMREFARHWTIYLGGVIIPLAVYAVFIGFPVLSTMYLSLERWNGLGAERVFVGLENWRNLFQDPSFTLSLTNNLKWAIVSLVVPVGGGLLLAVFLSSGKIYFGSAFRALMFLPSTMSLVTIGVMFALILNPVFGGLNEALRALRLSFLIHGWLDEPNLVLYTLTGVFTWHYLGMAMIMFHAGISQVPTELYETARIEGSGPLQTLWYVTIPMIRPVITVVTMLTVMISFRAFDIVMVMTRGGPFKQSNVLAYFMYLEAFQKYRYGYGAAIGICILLLSSIFAAIYLSRIAGEAEYVS